jgi:hypothetical protein
MARAVIAYSGLMRHSAKMKRKLALVLLGHLTATAVFAGEPKPRPLGVEASIPFANHGGIQNFSAIDDDVLMIEDQRRNWYRAELFGPCHGLQFANHIGFITRGTSSFDRFSQILVNGENCQVRSLVTAAKPLSKKERKARGVRASPS